MWQKYGSFTQPNALGSVAYISDNGEVQNIGVMYLLGYQDREKSEWPVEVLSCLIYVLVQFFIYIVRVRVGSGENWKKFHLKEIEPPLYNASIQEQVRHFITTYAVHKGTFQTIMAIQFSRVAKAPYKIHAMLFWKITWHHNVSSQCQGLQKNIKLVKWEHFTGSRNLFVACSTEEPLRRLHSAHNFKAFFWHFNLFSSYGTA